MPILYENTGPVDCTIDPDLSNLKHKSVIVTGGSSGIGAGYVKAFLEAGAYVTNADIQPDEAQTGSSNYTFVKCDVRHWEDQLAVFKSAVSKSPHHSVDIVIANAGISGDDHFFQLDGDEPTEPDMKIADVNYKGVFYTAKLALHYFNNQPITPDRDRCFIITASLAAYVDPLEATTYQTSKFAVRGLMCNLRRSGLMRANLIAPFFVDTPILGYHGPAFKQMLTSHGLDFATPEDCAKAAMRIATDTTINGHGFGIVPKQMSPDGYVDMDHDSPKEGTLLAFIETAGNKQRAMAAAAAAAGKQ